MSRQKEYCREQVLEKATTVFWEKGFEGASMQDLVTATGLNRFGMYQAFENKEGLFRAVLQSYLEKGSSFLYDKLKEEPRGIKGIYAFYERLFELMGSTGKMKGCLILNTAIDGPCRDLEIVKMIRNHYGQAQKLFQENLEEAKEKGEISHESDTDAVSQYLVGINHAIMVMHRLDTPLNETKNFLATALKTIRTSVQT